MASIIVTHSHIDHTRAIQAVADNVAVQHYVDNGQVDGVIGTGNPWWIRTVATGRGIEVCEVLEDDIRSLHPPQDLADASIDAVDCETCDPRIIVLSWQLPDGTGMSDRVFGNKNEHSIVTRVDIGDSSFQVTGDLEEAGIARLLEQVHGADLLDVDVYELGHHGSYNATTDELLSAMTPEIAIISCGRWTDGRSDAGNPFSTWRYGHPRAETVDRLPSVLTRRRSEPLSVNVFDALRESRRVKIRKSLYATGWEGNIGVRATSTGRFLVKTNL